MKQIIDLPKGSYISEIEPFRSTGIPTNSIIHKEVTGCGITTFEIQYALHNSIIILPNVPVIKDKVALHNKEYPKQEILGVHKGIDVHDIQVYLLKDVRFKKILTTPEGFTKIVKAFDGELESMYKDYFLLFDECERIITDVAYRGKIAAPIEYFFKFQHKALVSATTLPFSDVRFKDFKYYVIRPDYDHSQPLTLVSTNNVLSSLKLRIDQLQSDHVCIFINSTNGIYAITETLGVKSDSKAYCSQDSVVKLMEKRYMHASNELRAKEMVKHNLFTSRYYSAIDIKLDYKPDVFIVSDIYFAPHSIIDPHTEAIQIAGRFRKGINTLTHITNFNPLMEVKTQDEAKSYLMGCLDTYEHIQELYNKESHKGRRDSYRFFVKESPLASFFNDGIRNSFMIDNDLNEERVKGYYLAKENLQEAYNDVSNHFTLTFEDESYPVGDDDMYVLNHKETKVEKAKHVAHLLQRYTAKPGHYILFLSEAIQEQKNILTRRYPLVAEAVRLVGVDHLDKVGYDTDVLKKVIRDANTTNLIRRLAPFVQARFAQHTFTSEKEIIDRLCAVYAEQKVAMRLFASHILKWFNGRRTTEGGINGYKLFDRVEFT
jgi:hypothetical protein